MASETTIPIPDKFETPSEANERRTSNFRFRNSPNGGFLVAVQFSSAIRYRKTDLDDSMARLASAPPPKKYVGGRLT
jgi:hypothetical protein